MSLISVSIVDYNKASRVVETYNYLKDQTVFNDCFVIIFDNSEDERNFAILSAGVPQSDHARLIKSDRNIGYTKATNKSVLDKADYIVLLNPDVALEDPRTIEACIGLLEANPDYGVVGVRQVDDGGTPQLVARSFPRLGVQVARRCGWPLNRIFSGKISNYECSSQNFSQSGIYPVDWVQSSFWVVRGALWRQLGGLNEKFFLFMSEADFSQRAADFGFKTIINCDVFARSDGIRVSRGGVASVFTSKVVRAHIFDALRYHL